MSKSTKRDIKSHTALAPLSSGEGLGVRPPKQKRPGVARFFEMLEL
jgi:hypothetical protein